jgi:hypothetical protein
VRAPVREREGAGNTKERGKAGSPGHDTVAKRARPTRTCQRSKCHALAGKTRCLANLARETEEGRPAPAPYLFAVIFLLARPRKLDELDDGL